MSWSWKKVARPRESRSLTPFPVSEDLGRRYLFLDYLNADVRYSRESNLASAWILGFHDLAPVRAQFHSAVTPPERTTCQ